MKKRKGYSTNKQDNQTNKKPKTDKQYQDKEGNKQTGQINRQIHHKIFRMNIHRSKDRLKDGG